MQFAKFLPLLHIRRLSVSRCKGTFVATILGDSLVLNVFSTSILMLEDIKSCEQGDNLSEFTVISLCSNNIIILLHTLTVLV